MRILFIAPLSPPVSGHSLAAEVLYEHLVQHHQIAVVNLSKQSFKEGIDSASRIFQVFNILKEVWQKRKEADVIYLTVSESLAGNVKDLLIYVLCFRDIHKMVIHLHGGSIKKLLFDKMPAIFKLNKYFISRLAGVIILGKSHLDIFSGTIDRRKIYIVPNFAEDAFFVRPEDIKEKFTSNPFRMLFMSNMIPKKGYNELINAFLDLDDNVKKQIRLDFAGSFDSEELKNVFLEKIKGLDQVRYHGIVKGNEKKRLFSKAHVFCLPTVYFEGQPISILEAYASGCVVVTTVRGGIGDIFTNNINGFEIEAQSTDSIKSTIEKLLAEREHLHQIATFNHTTALEKYRTDIYSSRVETILKTV